MILHVKPPKASKAKGSEKPIQRTKKTKKSVLQNEADEITETVAVKKSKSVRRTTSEGERIVFTDDDEDLVHSDLDHDRDEIEDAEADLSAPRGSAHRADEPIDNDHEETSRHCFQRLMSLRDSVSVSMRCTTPSESNFGNVASGTGS